MEKIYVNKIDNVWMFVDCSSGVAMELNEYFSFFVPGYKFMPKYKNKIWDGRIRLFNYNKRILYIGLITHLKKFCTDRQYEINIEDSIENKVKFTVKESIEFLKTLDLPFVPKEHQVKAFIDCVRYNRGLIISPTASGKSLLMYILARYYNKKTLVLVPVINLVNQLYGDFEDYSKKNGWSTKNNVHMIYQGQDKHTDKLISISTWQSVYKMPKSYFNQFDVIIADECHLFQANSLKGIMEKCTKSEQKFGMTGTLDGTKTHRIVLEGLFRPVNKIVSTKELIDKKFLSNLEIKCIILNYENEIRNHTKKFKYKDEIDFLVDYEPRNEFICNLALSLKGNTLVMFNYVKHGELLYEMMNKISTDDVNIHLIHGKTPANERERIRKLMIETENNIGVTSFGTTSTGVNIPNLKNSIFASPSKSRIRNLQSIGRILRKHGSKDKGVLYDLSDNLIYKSWKNHTYTHMEERMKLYIKEDFDFKVHKIRV